MSECAVPRLCRSWLWETLTWLLDSSHLPSLPLRVSHHLLCLHRHGKEKILNLAYYITVTRSLLATTKFTNFEKIRILLSVASQRWPGTIGEGLISCELYIGTCCVDRKNLVSTRFNFFIWMTEVISGGLVLIPSPEFIMVFFFVPNFVSPIFY